MKKIYQYICILAAMVLSAPTVALAEDDVKGGLIFNKQVASNTPDEEDGHYTINIDAYATGTMVTTTVTESKPADIALVLDYSSSMVRERLSNYYKLPYERALTYDDYQLVATTSPTSSTPKEKAEYYYKMGDNYYAIDRAEVSIGGEETTYYYLYWQEGAAKRYFDGNAVNGNAYPKKYTGTNQTIYTGGNIFTKNGDQYEKSDKTSLTYADVHDSGVTYYYNTGGDPEEAGKVSYYYVLTVPEGAQNERTKYLDSNGTYDNAYTNITEADQTIYEGVLYTAGDPLYVMAGGKDQNKFSAHSSTDPDETFYTGNVYSKSGQNYTQYNGSYSWNQLKDNDYYYCKKNEGKGGARYEKFELSTSANYNALPSAAYSYNTIINSTETYYWKKDNNNYKPVSAQQLTITAPQPDYRQISAGSETVVAGGTKGYALTFTADGTTYYLTDDPANPHTTSPTGVATTGATIYSGDLYSNTRLVSLQIAAGDFLDEIAAKTAGANGILGDEDDVDNNLELVLFCQSVFYKPGLEDVTQENIDKWKAEMYKHPGYTGTAHDLAMAEAESTLTAAHNADTGNERMQTVVFFTDGETYNSGTGNTNRVSDANKALVSSNNLKKIGVPIFVVSMLSQDTLDDYAWITWFLETLSSKYGYLEGVTKDTKMMVTSRTSPYKVNETTSTRGSQFTGSTNYYLTTDDTSDLSSIFRAITKEIHTGEGSDVQLGANSVVVVDAMTKHFKLPDGATEEDIIVKAYPCSGKNENGEFTFDESNAVTLGYGVLKDAHVYVKGKEVDVVGFDYAANYVGEHGEEGVYEGYKLVISFPIYIDPANPGGANLQTNEAYSGIYTTNVDKDGNPVIKDGLVERKDPVSYFEQPQVDLPNIVIRKEGMQVGESATFLITEVGGDANDAVRVIITCTEADKDKQYISAKVKLGLNGRYKVQETQWSWGYTPEAKDGTYEGSWTTDESKFTTSSKSVVVNNATTKEYSITRDVNDLTQEVDGKTTLNGKEVDTKGTIYYFKNTKTTKLNEMKYSEAHKRNVFKTPDEYEWHGFIGTSGEIDVDTDKGADEPGE